MNSGNRIEGSLIFLFGLLWILLSARLQKFYRPALPAFLLIANLIAAAYIYFNLIQMNVQVFMDYFICTVLFLLINYGVVYLSKINSKKSA